MRQLLDHAAENGMDLPASMSTIWKPGQAIMSAAAETDSP